MNDVFAMDCSFIPFVCFLLSHFFNESLNILEVIIDLLKKTVINHFNNYLFVRTIVIALLRTFQKFAGLVVIFLLKQF